MSKRRHHEENYISNDYPCNRGKTIEYLTEMKDKYQQPQKSRQISKFIRF